MRINLKRLRLTAHFIGFLVRKTIAEWKNQTPSDFLFSLKFPQRITHFKMLKDCEEDTEFFLEKANLLGQKLGVLLLQFPPMFKQDHFQLLKDYIKQLAAKISLCN